MTTAFRFQRSWPRTSLTMALGAAALLTLSLGTTGCGDDSNAGTDLTAGSPGAVLTDVPALADLQARLNLSDEQSREMDRILTSWRADAGERMERRTERHMARDGAAGHHGKREGGRGARFMTHFGGPHGIGAGFLTDAPGFDHLADASAVLDDDQLAIFVTFIEERRAARREGQDENGPRFDGPMAKRMAAHMGLSDDEATELRKLHGETTDRMRDLHRNYGAGTITPEQLRDGLREVRLAAENRARGLMGEDEFNRMFEQRTGMKDQMLKRRVEKLDERVERQADRLARALRLDDAGEARLATALEQTLPARRQLLEQLKAGEMKPEDAVYEGIRIERDASVAIRATLSPEEAARFETLRRLLPGTKSGHGRG